MLIAVIKPWASSSPGAASPRPVTNLPAAVIASPSGTPAELGHAASRYCEYTSGWRIASIERSGGMEWRAWKAIEPAVGLLRGPDDPAIPFVEVIAEIVPALGYCAPSTGPERPDVEATMVAWRVAEARGSERLSLHELVPLTTTILGALFSPPSSANGGWPSGRYVFRVGDRWLGVEVRLVPARPAPTASAAPSPMLRSQSPLP